MRKMTFRGIFKSVFWRMQQYGFFNKVSDDVYLKWMYRIWMGKKLNLDEPKTFNEKLQWLKLHDRKPMYTQMVDKCEAKKYVSEKIGGGYIIPTLGVWNSFDEIDFDELPDQFVLKTTHDSGGVVICRDKSAFDINLAKKKIVKSLKTNYYMQGREWPYKDVQPRIIAEKFMIDETGDTITDYKFYCFNGEPRYLYVSYGLEDHRTAALSFLTLNWEFAPFSRSDYKAFEELPKKPHLFNEMVEIAKHLASNIDFIRIDLYEINNQIYFSELTFYPCSGLMLFVPEEWDYRMGRMLDLS